ncbi:transcription factor MYB14-like [Senna tora]|uniref:Transcription factor MYB14-like n=1 Tax=Senna tora TaxID=362788 RepID=A0A834SYL0_9FABA|nr:transcription factor MYB14-like [Senna tora]
MVRGAYYDKNGVKKGAWSKEEDERLRAYVERYGHSNWRQLPKLAGRTDNEVKNHWHSHLKKRVELCNCNDELQMKPTCEIQTTHENPIPPANAPPPIFQKTHTSIIPHKYPTPTLNIADQIRALKRWLSFKEFQRSTNFLSGYSCTNFAISSAHQL